MGNTFFMKTWSETAYHDWTTLGFHSKIAFRNKGFALISRKPKTSRRKW